jgi:hypothetical protein
VLQEFIADPIEEYIFRTLINEEFGDDVENAVIIWKPIIEEDKNMRSQRLIQLLQAGAVSVNEVREEMGFKTISDEKYNSLEVKEPAVNPTGFPPKNQPEDIEKEKPESENKKVVEKSKTPSESHMKLEGLKLKKFELMQIDEAFRNKMLELTQKTKFDLRDNAKLVKDVKKEAMSSANRIINEHITSSYLLGRLNANTIIGKEDDLTVKKEDLKEIAVLKDKFVDDFGKVVSGMIKSKEEGKLT